MKSRRQVNSTAEQRNSLVTVMIFMAKPVRIFADVEKLSTRANNKLGMDEYAAIITSKCED